MSDRMTRVAAIAPKLYAVLVLALASWFVVGVAGLLVEAIYKRDPNAASLSVIGSTAMMGAALIVLGWFIWRGRFWAMIAAVGFPAYLWIWASLFSGKWRGIPAWEIFAVAILFAALSAVVIGARRSRQTA
jgi:hypothetical protein